MTRAKVQAAEPVHSGDGYQLPPIELQRLVDAPRPPRSYISPHKDWLVQLQFPELPGISLVSQPEKKLAGLRFHAETRSATNHRPGCGIWLQRISDGQIEHIDGLPDPLSIDSLAWSPDQSFIAFNQIDTASGINELWLIDITTRRAVRLLENLNTLVGAGYHWMPDSKHLVVLLQVNDSAIENELSSYVPTGPAVQETKANAQVSSVRTYQDMLKNERDAREFEYYLNCQPAIVNVQGELREIGQPDIYVGLDPSPDGNYLLVQRIERPFSYEVPLVYFPRRIDVVDIAGNHVHEVTRRPLFESIPPGFDAVLPGPRSVEWRSDAPNSLVWVDAQDGGDPANTAITRDTLFIQEAPFNAPPRRLIDLSYRVRSILWGKHDLALVEEFWWGSRQIRQWRIFPDTHCRAPELISERSSEDRYNSPGMPVMVADAVGRSRLWISGEDTLLLMGMGASPEGDRPFLDSWSLGDNSKTRLFQSSAPYYEAPLIVLNRNATELLISRESPTQPTNLYVHDLTGKQALRALTNYPHPSPELRDVVKEQIRYTRSDGVELTGDLYLPPGYDVTRDGPLPVLMWAYPREFKSAEAASQVRGSPYRFNSISYWGALPFLTRGFVVLEGPGMPIVGAGDQEPNDTYLEQLTASAQAAVDELARRGVGDAQRCAIGGHSYGAFMTANLLAHTNLFKAGIARSGAYNRTLTPFGFQAEERNYWQAPDVYRTMSPFDHADRIKTPLLMIHGADDSNSGTFPLQSERMYAAIKGLGGEARLVMLPNESHAYRARESILHMLYEQDVWLQKHVVNASDEPKKEGE